MRTGWEGGRGVHDCLTSLFVMCSAREYDAKARGGCETSSNTPTVASGNDGERHTASPGEIRVSSGRGKEHVSVTCSVESEPSCCSDEERCAITLELLLMLQVSPRGCITDPLVSKHHTSFLEPCNVYA